MQDVAHFLKALFVQELGIQFESADTQLLKVLV